MSCPLWCSTTFLSWELPCWNPKSCHKKCRFVLPACAQSSPWAAFDILTVQGTRTDLHMVFAAEQMYCCSNPQAALQSGVVEGCTTSCAQRTPLTILQWWTCWCCRTKVILMLFGPKLAATCMLRSMTAF